MPIIDELSTAPLIAHIATDYLSARSSGVHMKAIIDDYIEHHGLAIRAKKSSGFTEEELDKFGAIGFAWERVVCRALASGALDVIQEAILGASGPPPAALIHMWERAFGAALNNAEREYRPREIVKPGEVIVDGIACTADAINTRWRCLEEWKATWTSAVGSIESSHPDWMMQIPGYIHAHGLDPWAILRVFYVNGAYERVRMGAPVAKMYRLRWSDEEIEENWEQIRGHKGVMTRRDRGGEAV